MRDVDISERHNFNLVVINTLTKISGKKPLWLVENSLEEGKIFFSSRISIKWILENKSLLCDYYERTELENFEIERMTPSVKTIEEFLSQKEVKVKCSYLFSKESDITLSLNIKIEKTSDREWTIVI